MRITPLLVTEAVIAALLAIGCLFTYSSGSRRRRMGVAWRSARKAMQDGERDDAIESLERFVRINPRCPGVRLQLAGLFLEADKIAEARGQIELVAAGEEGFAELKPDEKKRLRALAEVILGMMDGREAVAASGGSAGEGQAKAKEAQALFASAQAHFKKAVEIEYPAGLKAPSPGAAGAGRKASKPVGKNRPGSPGKDSKKQGKPAGDKSKGKRLVAFGDASAGLGLLALWGRDFQAADRHFRNALAGKSLLGKGVAADCLNGRGVVLAREPASHRQAVSMFRSALVLRPDFKSAKSNLSLLLKRMAGGQSMPAKQRARLLKNLAAASAKPDYATCNTLGCGYYHLGKKELADKYLAAAVNQDPAKRLAQFNLLALRWDALASAGEKYQAAHHKCYPPLKGDPLLLEWRTLPNKKPRPKKISATDLNARRLALVAYQQSQAAFLASLTGALEKVKSIPPEVERELLCIRYQLTRSAASRKAASKDAKTREEGARMLAACTKLLETAIGRFPQDHRFTRYKGIHLLERGDYPGALAALERSLAVRADQADIKDLKARLAPPPEVVGIRPMGGPLAAAGAIVARSSRPLLGALFRVHDGGTQLTADRAVLKVDGKAVRGTFWGSELLFRPELRMGDGSHAVTAEVADLMGRKASGRLVLMVDNSPPTLNMVQPLPGAAVTERRPKLIIEYSDKYSGIATSSVEVRLSSQSGASKYFRKVLVTGGNYTFTYEDKARKIKIARGKPVGSSRMLLVPHPALGTGPYLLTVTVGDARGNSVTKEFRILVPQ
jgi:tetratricopeptide (TPR) repeat protein